MEDDESPYEIALRIEARPCAARRRLIFAAVRRTLESRGFERARLSIAVVGDAKMAELHLAFLGKRGPTDVLTFPLAETGDDRIEGEIVVSQDTAAREAAARGHGVEAELLLYIVHGVLHLVGYDDGRAGDARRMHRAEDRILSELGVGRVFTAGAS